LWRRVGAFRGRAGAVILDVVLIMSRKGNALMVIKRLRAAWHDDEVGSVVVLDNDRELVAGSVVEATATVRELISDWEGPNGVTVAAGTRVELDEATAKELGGLGLLGPTVI
jgi:hypothetical protein